MNFQKAVQAIRQDEIKPVYFVQGSEKYLIDEFLHTLLDHLGPSDSLDALNLDLAELSINAVIEEANVFSFFADQRIIVVDQADFVSTSPSYRLSKSEEKNLLAYLENPNPATILIFLSRTDSMDKRRKLAKSLQKLTCLVEVSPMDERAVDRYVRQYLANSTLSLNKYAIDELLNRVNYQLSLAMIEIQKLETYALSSGPIDVATIRQLVPRTLETDVFELTKAVTSKNIKQAVQIYQDLILMKNEPIALHALLVSQFRLMVQVKLMLSQGLMQGQIAKYLNVHPYRVKLASQSVQSRQLKDLLQLYDELAEVDFHMKTGFGLRDSHFYLLLLKMAAI